MKCACTRYKLSNWRRKKNDQPGATKTFEFNQ